MDNTASCMIEVCDLHKHYKDVHVLRGISTTVAKGEVCAVIGPSGSGKSTFLRCLNRLEEASSGEIFINAQEITDPHLNLNKMRENIGMVFQNYAIFPHLSVRENVAYGLKLRKLDKHTIQEKVTNILKLVGLEGKMSRHPHEMSGGEQQRLAIALAVMHDPDLLILDEPTSGLDPVSRDELLQILSEYIEDGEHSVLFSTHITGDLERAADYITYISYGELFFSGSKDEFVDMFRIVKGGTEELSADLKEKAVGVRTFPTGFEALVKTEDTVAFSSLSIEPATIDEIVVFTSKKGDDYE